MADKPRPKCFIIMPITTPKPMEEVYAGKADHFRHVLDCLFVPAVEEAGFEAVRPVAKGADLIHATIISQLESSELVLCDMSSLNANVFFELGIRTALNKPVCMVIDDVSPSVPFDATIINYHKYGSALEGWTLENERKAMAAHVKASAVETNNTLWKYLGVSGVAQAPATPNEDDRIDYLSRQIESVARMLKGSHSKRVVGSGESDDAQRSLAGPAPESYTTGVGKAALRHAVAEIVSRVGVREFANSAGVTVEVVIQVLEGQSMSDQEIGSLLKAVRG